VFTARRPDESRPGKDSYSLWDIPIKPGSSVVAGEPKQLLEWRDFHPTDLSITSDGKRLSFLKNRDWDDVYLGELAPDGASMEAPRRFTLDDRGIRSLDSWTPDSQAILFSSDRNGTAEVFRQGLKESVAESLVQGPQDHYNSALSPDQSWMLYVESAPTTVNAAAPPQRLMRQPAAGGSPEIVLQDPGGDIFAHQWDYRCPVKPGSPCVLCDVLGEKNRNDIAFYSLDPVRGKGEQLGRIEADFFLSGRWSISPDGSRLALLDGEGKIDVLTFRDHNWHKVLVAPPWGGLYSIAWAADGKGFFASCQRPLNSFTLLHVTLDGKAKPLYPADHRWVVSPLPSPDGKYLAFDGETRDTNVWMLEGF
jgi:Tol biopolymer transport system component